MKIDLLDPFNGMLCVMGEICGFQGMTFHGNLIELRICNIVVMGIKKGSMKMPSTSLTTSKMKHITNGIILRHKKDIVICK
jgi:hypothetical protein